MGAGFSEEEALDMPLNKVFLFTDTITERDIQRRKESVADLVNSIGMALSGKGFKEYIEEIGKGHG